jgi:phosphate starvation-inducible PhoH-like protein
MHKILQLESLDEARQLFGKKDRNLRLLRDRFDVRIITRNGVVRLEGDEPGLSRAADALEDHLRGIRRGKALTEEEFEARLDEESVPREPSRPAAPGIRVEKSLIQPKSPGQRRYLETIQKHPVVFCIGPAGTGKTFLAVAMALHELVRGHVGKIVLARPAVEAGESLGFLPGDYQAKINPYLRPLYDALSSIVDPGRMRKYVEKEIIEIVPLAYMRGRTLDHAFIILDEGQNSTAKQMKMFLTRMGNHSKIVVTGDITQIDLPQKVSSGLVEVRRILRGVRGVAFVELGKEDIVRHPIVQDIVEAFSEREEASRRDGNEEEPASD